MSKPKYYTLMSGYRVLINDPDVSKHLASAIVGENILRTRADGHPRTSSPVDQMVRNVYQECEYLNRKYGIPLWAMLAGAMSIIAEAGESFEKDQEEKEDEGECSDDECAGCEERAFCPMGPNAVKESTLN